GRASRRTPPPASSQLTRSARSRSACAASATSSDARRGARDTMGVSDERVLLRGTAANVVGLLAGVAAARGVQGLLGRTLPAGGLALVTIAVQVAFVASAGARFGMDVAAVRLVAIAEGAGDPGTLRGLLALCACVAPAASIVVAGVIAAAAPLTGDRAEAIAIGAAGIPFIAVANVYLG